MAAIETTGLTKYYGETRGVEGLDLTDFEWVGALTFPRYYDTAPILTRGEDDLTGAAVLLAVTALVLAVSVW